MRVIVLPALLASSCQRRSNRSRASWSGSSFFSGCRPRPGTIPATSQLDWLLHLGVDADTGQIAASALTSKDVDDGTQADPLLDQIDGTIGSFTGDGAYDQAGVYASVTKRHPGAAVIVPPRSSAVLSADAEAAPTP